MLVNNRMKKFELIRFFFTHIVLNKMLSRPAVHMETSQRTRQMDLPPCTYFKNYTSLTQKKLCVCILSEAKLSGEKK